MLTSEQVIKYLIKTDLDLQSRNEKTNAFGLATLVELGTDKDIKDIKMVDVLEYIHIFEKALDLACNDIDLIKGNIKNKFRVSEYLEQAKNEIKKI